MKSLWLLWLAAILLFAGGPGFRSQRHLDDHYEKVRGEDYFRRQAER